VPRTFGFAEHVVDVWGRELHPDAEVCAHPASDSSFRHKVGVKLEDWCERARLGVMAGMQVFDAQEDCYQIRTCVVFRLKKSHPHIVGVVVDDEQAVAEAMWGGDIDKSLEISGQVEEGAGWFRASGGVARSSCGFV
jgi:hypothetical protein